MGVMAASDIISPENGGLKAAGEQPKQETIPLLLIHEDPEEMCEYSSRPFPSTFTPETASVPKLPKGKQATSSSNTKSAQAHQINHPSTNPLSIQGRRSMSTSSSDMMKRIVETQTIVIWQAYDTWRQKFPRPHEEEDHISSSSTQFDRMDAGFDGESLNI